MPRNKKSVGVGMAPSNSELGKFIRERRLELKLSQFSLEDQARLRRGVITTLEIGKKKKFLRDDELEKLSEALQCERGELKIRIPYRNYGNPKTELGHLIRNRRVELDITIEDFAKKLDISLSRVKYLESGKDPRVGLNLAKPLAEVLNIEMATIAKYVGKSNKPSKSNLGQMVRNRRKELSMNATQLAKELNVSRQYVNQVEYGIVKLCENDEMIEKLSKVLKMDLQQLQAVRPHRRLKKKKFVRPGVIEFLVEKRLENRLTQREVAERAKLRLSTISGMENGMIFPDSTSLTEIAQSLKCQLPEDLLAQYCMEIYSISGKKPWIKKERTNPLSKFVTSLRIKHGLTQFMFAKRAQVSTTAVIGIENGSYIPGHSILEEISRTFDCEIPSDLIPQPKPRKKNVPTKKCLLKTAKQDCLSEQNFSNIEKILEMSEIEDCAGAVQKALHLLRRLLERKKEGYETFLRRGKEVVELELIF